jgi:CRISPR system Cascade subunit CasC
MEAAAQVAHAITVHKVAVEDDFFTAVDDLNTGMEDAGAGHMGETEFGSGLYYLYICINRNLLTKNLQNDKTLASRALAALLEAAATVSPSGKQNSFASRTRASYILAEKGEQQPRSLSVAFLKPVQGMDVFDKAVESIRNIQKNMDAMYGPCYGASMEMNAHTGEGETLETIKQFILE